MVFIDIHSYAYKILRTISRHSCFLLYKFRNAAVRIAPICLPDNMSRSTIKPTKSAQSEQSLRCALSGLTQGFVMRTAKTLINRRMPRLIWFFSGRTCHFVVFFHVTRLISLCLVNSSVHANRRGLIYFLLKGCLALYEPGEWLSFWRVTSKQFWVWALSWENLSSGFATRYDSNRTAQLQRLARVLKFWILANK